MRSSLRLKVAGIFSPSISGTAAVSPFSFPQKIALKSSRSLSSQTKPKATVSDLLSLLGSPDQARSVNSQLAQELRSCFRFLVHETLPARRSLTTTPSIRSRKYTDEYIDELILSPPRLTLDFGADRGAILQALDPTIIPVPDFEGSNKHRCQLTKDPYGKQFIDKGLNSYLKLLFEIIVERGPSVGLDVSLSRYDLFHGHLFLAKESRRVGILFHAKEYPACDIDFPYDLGHCQVGSNVAYDDSMNLRNILWLAPLPSNSSKAWATSGVLVVLDAHPEKIIYRDLIHEHVKMARTLYEDDFGEVVVDVNYLNVGFQLFICAYGENVVPAAATREVVERMTSVAP